MQKKKIKTKDNEWMYLNYYPLSFERLDKETPTVVFLLGIFGSSSCPYAKIMAKMVNWLKWRFAIINRRGWDFNPLYSEKFFHEEDI